MRTTKNNRAAMGAKAKREPIATTLGNVLDSEYADFLYSRRHLAMVRKGNWVGPRYIVELQELEQAMSKVLDRIRKRDGTEFFNEAVDHVLIDVAMLIERHDGLKALHRAVHELQETADIINAFSAARREIAAHHDAGHAVMALAPVSSAWIRPRGASRGRVRTARAFEADLFISLAGPMMSVH
jgi:hypothetical protein